MIKIFALVVDASDAPMEESLKRFEETKNMSDEEWAKHEKDHLEKRLLFATTTNSLYILPRSGEIIHHDRKDYFVYQVLWGTNEQFPAELSTVFLLLKEVNLADFRRKRSTTKTKKAIQIRKDSYENRAKDDIIFDIRPNKKDIN
jgi:hypothetical protein